LAFCGGKIVFSKYKGTIMKKQLLRLCLLLFSVNALSLFDGYGMMKMVGSKPIKILTRKVGKNNQKVGNNNSSYSPVLEDWMGNYSDSSDEEKLFEPEFDEEIAQARLYELCIMFNEFLVEGLNKVLRFYKKGIVPETHKNYAKIQGQILNQQPTKPEKKNIKYKIFDYKHKKTASSEEVFNFLVGIACEFNKIKNNVVSETEIMYIKNQYENFEKLENFVNTTSLTTYKKDGLIIRHKLAKEIVETIHEIIKLISTTKDLQPVATNW
jgi:hypothetical protein